MMDVTNQLNSVTRPSEAWLKPSRVVIVDDQKTGILILTEIIKSVDQGAQIVSFSNPLEAIEYVQTNLVDLVLTDFKMPIRNGIETTRELRKIYGYEELPIVILTVVQDREVLYEAFEAGATDFLLRPIDPTECRVRCRNLLNLRKQYLINSQHSRFLEKRVEAVTEELRLREVDTLFRLSLAAERRDAITGKHLNRMAKYSYLIARGLGMSQAESEAIELAAPMHDIGKIGIPDSILQKTGVLTNEEISIMQKHTQIGYEILKGSVSRYLQMAAVIALNHHEKFDGSGYPMGFRKDAIPLVARIVALADVFDALTSVRPYKDAWPWEKAIEYIIAEKARHFDPELVDVFVSLSSQAVQIRIENSD